MEASSNSPDIVAKLHQECGAAMLRVAWAILRDWDLASDAVQESFFLFGEKISSIEQIHWKGWLFKTVQFQAQNLRRTRQRATQLIDRLKEEKTEYAVNTRSNRDADEDRLELLKQAMQQLPEAQLQIVQLRLGSEKSFAEIAEQLQIPLGTVLSRMRLALEKLRQYMSQNDER
jgi:RNA polymerase sigma-70 factor, ECF subfamily